MIAAALFASLVLHAGSVEGTIIIKRRLTKRNVTPTVAAYQRGPAVPLGIAEPDEDPLSFERSRVVIYVEGAGPAGAPATATLEQRDRRFAPEIVVIPAGSSVSFPNLDPIFHNVFSLSKTKSFDLGNYPKGQSRTVAFPEPGIVFVNCHLHPNMAAAIVVTPNKWSAQAGRDGRFVLKDLPPGKYEVVAWHKAAGYFRKKIVVGAGVTGDVDFLIPLGEKK
ncbi:MAG TPA: carboxypeptidase regulatory-like domain-containing protein [Bryobacteraceae bacterium]